MTTPCYCCSTRHVHACNCAGPLCRSCVKCHKHCVCGLKPLTPKPAATDPPIIVGVKSPGQ